jgi:hypothetical protein
LDQPVSAFGVELLPSAVDRHSAYAPRDDAETTKHVIARRAQPDEAIHAAAGSEDQAISAVGTFNTKK